MKKKLTFCYDSCCGSMMSFCCLLGFVHCFISQQLDDGMPWNFVTDINSPQRMSPPDFGDWLTFHLAFSAMFWLALNGLPWNLVQTLMFPSRMSCNNFGEHFIWRNHQVDIFNLTFTLIYNQIPARCSHRPQLYFLFSANQQLLAC